MGPPNLELERLLRQATVALLAVPILVAIYFGALVRHSVIVRSGLLVSLVLILGMGVIDGGGTQATVATAPKPILPLTDASFTTAFSTNRALTEPVSIRFNAAMDEESVAAAISVEPPTPIVLAWDASGAVLTIAPRGRWVAGTFHTITIQPGALARSGQPLARPIRAAFLTRDATTASAAATQRVGDRVAVTTAFVVTFASPVAPDTVDGAVRLDPPTLGTTEAITTLDGVTRLTFRPKQPLLPDVAYRLTVSGIRDTDGVQLDPVVLAVRTAKAPAVVRFRPVTGASGVARDAVISVRFTQAMDRRTTARAFSVSAGGEAVGGKVAWAEHDTVLVFHPTAALPFASTVSMDVALGAKAAGGASLAVAAHGTFKTVAAPVAPKPAAPRASSKPSTGRRCRRRRQLGRRRVVLPRPHELHADRRLGHLDAAPAAAPAAATWRRSGSTPGSARRSPGRTRRSWPSTTSAATSRRQPRRPPARAGYTSYVWAENLGCRSGTRTPRSSARTSSSRARSRTTAATTST